LIAKGSVPHNHIFSCPSALSGANAGPRPRKLRGENCGAIHHFLNRGDRRERVFQTDLGRVPFPDTLSETRRKTGWQDDVQKLNPARWLHQETTMT
jgi:hypothetical protein